ncbi:unnamed protein product [Caenorhabditis bovis]|uniref:Uncharacterized protein n=1 Tax=Caenorhabditis bovis TaxID=2654633 RepID=A0A8S1EFK0_9PELO|nr:unnamed protein product [Caenorhabditis bovis]
MARNAKSPTVPPPTPTTTLNQCQSIPTIRIDAPVKSEKPAEIVIELKPSPPPPETRSESRLSTRMPRQPRQPRQTSIRSGGWGANGNGVMKGPPPRETVVNFGFTEEPIPPNYYCCSQVKIIKTCRVVGVFSLIGFFINLVLYFMGISKLGLNGYFEAFLLIFDFISVMTLMCGVSKKRPGLLKPFMFYTTIWSIGLIILFLIFLVHLFRGTHGVSRNILENLRSINADPNEYRFRRPDSSSTAIIVTLLVTAAMVTVIVVECVFLHIVYRTFQYFAYNEEKRREESNKKERL